MTLDDVLMEEGGTWLQIWAETEATEAFISALRAAVVQGSEPSADLVRVVRGVFFFELRQALETARTRALHQAKVDRTIRGLSKAQAPVRPAAAPSTMDEDEYALLTSMGVDPDELD